MIHAHPRAVPGDCAVACAGRVGVGSDYIIVRIENHGNLDPDDDSVVYVGPAGEADVCNDVQQAITADAELLDIHADVPELSRRVPGAEYFLGPVGERDPGAAANTACAAEELATPKRASEDPLRASLAIFREAGIERIREKSLKLTRFLMDLVDEMAGPPFHYSIGNPREDTRRGGHVAVEHTEAARICKALKARGVIPDFRMPNVIRLAPIALYNSFHEVWQVARHLREIVVAREYERFPEGRELIA